MRILNHGNGRPNYKTMPADELLGRFTRKWYTATVTDALTVADRLGVSLEELAKLAEDTRRESVIMANEDKLRNLTRKARILLGA